MLESVLSHLNTMQISLLVQPSNRTIPLTSFVMQPIMADFVTLTAYKKGKIKF